MFKEFVIKQEKLSVNTAGVTREEVTLSVKSTFVWFRNNTFMTS